MSLTQDPSKLSPATPDRPDRAPTPEHAWRLFAAAVAGRARVRVSRDGGRSYPAGCEQALTEVLPQRPAAVMLFDDEAAARCLAADFDASRGAPGRAEADAAAFAALLAACGGRSFTDVSPNGGRHVYVLWSRPRPITELRPLMRALCALYPTLDAAPMLNPAAGCIRPPGSRHRSGGHQQLVTGLAEALAALADPCGPQVWAALLGRLSPDLDAEPDPGDPPTPTVHPGARLSDRIEQIARTGVWDPDRYRSASEARQAVVTAAAQAGWSLLDVARRLEAGSWPGLAGLYARYGTRARRPALARDLRKAQAHLNRVNSGRNSNTRGSTHSGGTATGHPAQRDRIAVDSEYRWIRAWWNAVHATESTRWTNRPGLSRRLVLRALGAMAQRRGTRVVEVGVRSLALGCGLDHSTVSLALRALREEADPVIELLELGRGERADRYSLRIPDAGLHAAAWRAWQAGPIRAIHPVFRELGAGAALVHETLSREALPRKEITRAAALAPTTVDDALRRLAEHGLAERDPRGGWRQGPVTAEEVAAALGVGAVVAELVDRYRSQRTAWRELLDRLGRRTLIPVRRKHVPDPLLWPAALVEPPPGETGDLDYDHALALTAGSAEVFEAAVELLRRELGATALAAG